MRRFIRNVGVFVLGCLCGAYTMSFYNQNTKNKLLDLSRKDSELFRLMYKWMSIKQSDLDISEYFQNRGINKIAIYGVNNVGRVLINELVGSCINVSYGIDRKPENAAGVIKMLKPDDSLEEVDAIVVTAIHQYDEIEKMLSHKVDYRVVSISDVIDSLLYEKMGKTC